MPAIVAEGLKKRFGDTQALDGVDLEVEAATVLALLGPNGAGKTTAVRVFTTLLRPDAGRAFIDGIDVLAEPQRVRSRIGLTGQYAAVDERLTGRENLEHVGRLFHLGGAEAKRRGADLLERFDLADAANRAVKGYSGGMRRRLDIAMSLIARPSVLFLDEPTTGLDPRSRLAMWDLIDELVREGTTTLLTTQYLDEADRLANQIAVVDHGHVIAKGTAAELKSEIGEQLEVTMHDTADVDAGLAVLRTFACAPGHTVVGERVISVPIDRSDGIVPRAVRALDEAGLAIEDVVVRRPTLDDVFLRLTGHTAETEEVTP
jgi:ABC-2 type transport system ATP-binding protein